MKKLLLSLILALICFIGYFYASPYIAVHEIKKGITEQDPERLSENIDFPVLRQNLKEQFNTHMMKEMLTKLKDNPFGPLGVFLASKLIDGMVEVFVTPSSLAMLMEGKKIDIEIDRVDTPDKENNHESTKLESKRDRHPFRNAKYSFDSINKFSIRVPSEYDKEVRFVLTRKGLSWKLSNIIVPIGQ